MTTLGTHEGGLPRLAQSLSNNGIRTRWWACISAVILAVACGTAWLVLGAQGELVATKEVLGWPLVAIGESGRSTSNLIWWPVAVAEEPRGWFSIGRRPVGFFAFGFQPTGVIAVGQFPVGVISIGWVAVGVLPVGIWSLGLISLGLASVGWLSFGVVSLAWYAYAEVVSVGAYAWGQRAYGVYLASSRRVQPRPEPVAKLLSSREHGPRVDSVSQSGWMRKNN